MADGLAASSAFGRIASGELLPDEDATSLPSALLEYCKMDTLAMVEIHKKLLSMCSQPIP